jgi:hypothetical protein
MPQDDPLRARLNECTTDKATEQTKAICRELDKLGLDAKRLPDENILMLCDQSAVRGDPVCQRPELGMLFEKLLGSGDRVLAPHLIQRQGEFPMMRYFIYGHTHDLKERWKPEGISHVQAMNSGAFFRVIGERGYLDRIRQKGISVGEGLKKISLEQLPSCYTFVKQIPPDKEPQVFIWIMKEEDTKGRIVDPGDSACE